MTTFVYKYQAQGDPYAIWHADEPPQEYHHVDRVAIVIRDSPQENGLIVQPMGHERPVLIDYPIGWIKRTGLMPLDQGVHRIDAQLVQLQIWVKKHDAKVATLRQLFRESGGVTTQEAMNDYEEALKDRFEIYQELRAYQAKSGLPVTELPEDMRPHLQALPPQPPKFYAYYRPREAWFFLGEFTDKDKAMTEVQKKVSTIGLRCLFIWNDQDQYTCSDRISGIRGKLLTERMAGTEI